MRRKTSQRKTKETAISLSLNLDGKGEGKIQTGVGFLDHMLDLLARHSGIDLKVKAVGDLHVDDHHLVEDVGLVLGKTLKEALGKKQGIARYGWAVLPMDESLVMCALDLGGRPYLAYGLKLPAKRIKGFETELIEEFFRAVTNSGAINLHLTQLAGRNTHHIIEAAFKAFARALGQAVAPAGRTRGVPSTKGVL
ncbi:MAG: imidazoleglycerol-phosphate dehydratase HisB [Proteobacteria bacterium]|nr:imidazoleglycerol-phosphate dehydratase HisB [Pseudomonadota bacterium]